MKLFALVIIALILLVSLQSKAQERDKRLLADEATVRLAPTAFQRLPKNIVKYLKARKCSIPQSFINSSPHNVIRGQFARSGQFDWAVLCSRQRVSAILVFWNGSTKSVAEIARREDKDFLQVIADEKVGFSRGISVVGKDYILKHYLDYGGKKPPKSRHQGINDAFIEKASSVHYLYRGRWLELQGAD